MRGLPRYPARRFGEAGLTLVEMLVVLAIIGVMAGVAMLAIGRSGHGNAQAEARRLAARLSLASDETMVTDRAVAIDWDREGYRFVDWTGRAWVPSRVPALEPHKLGGGMVLAVAGTPARPLPIGPDMGGAGIDLAIGRTGDRWRVRFDGVNAVAEAADGT